MKVAFITGVTGQDGAYLSEFLLKKGYQVHGMKRRSSLFNTDRIDHLYQDPHVDNRNFFLHYGDMTDSTNITRLIKEIQPDEIYNLAAMSHVAVSFETPEYTGNTDGLGTLRILDAVRLLGLENKTRIYQASTSELFGKVQEVPQSETTPFYPRSPYGVAKIYGYWITVNYREAYGMYACNGILFNHESPLRGETFVTRKITRATSRIALGLQKKFYLGNLDAQRDWGHAKDYIRMMWMILQADEPEDWVIATGKTTSVRDFVKFSFAEVGIELDFIGNGVDEKAVVKSCDNPEYQIQVGTEVLSVDPKYYRPTEVDLLVGNPTKANTKLGWTPEYDLKFLVKDMMSSDIKLMKQDQYLKDGGYKHPGEAYHGDLGMIEENDIVLLISNSGETDEVLKLIPFLKHQKNCTISMSGNDDSTLAKNTNYHLDIAVDKEACPLFLAPTSSTTATLVMGDALAVTLMKLRDFKEENFAKFHPGGSLGRRLLTTVGDVMKKKNLPIISSQATIKEVIQRISEGKLGLVVIIDNNKIIGIITDGDIRRTMESREKDFFNLKAEDLMSNHPKLIYESDKLISASTIMSQHKINSLLVVNESNDLVGVVQVYDLGV